MWVGDASGLREAVQALPPSLASLDLLPGLRAGRGGGGAGGEWRLRWHMLPGWLGWPGVCNLQAVCAAFDRPGLPCCLTGAVRIRVAAPEEAGPGALGAYLGQCAELAGRLRGGGTGGLELTLEVDDEAAEADGAGEVAGGGGEAGDGYGGAGFLGRVLGAVLPAAAPHVRRLHVLLDSGFFMPSYSRHLTAPGLAFPLLEELLEGRGLARTASMAAADVVALARLAAPRLRSIGLLSPPWYPGNLAMAELGAGQAGRGRAGLGDTAP